MTYTFFIQKYGKLRYYSAPSLKKAKKIRRSIVKDPNITFVSRIYKGTDSLPLAALVGDIDKTLRWKI